MATIRSPLNPVPSPINSKFSLPDHTVSSNAYNFLPASPSSKRRRSLSVSASVQGNANGKEKPAQAAQLQGLVEQFNDSVNSKDSRSLPKPLSSTDVSRMESGGSRIRVAYQGVAGAYGESTAEKAYPNCEAVPCEQFDTAFEEGNMSTELYTDTEESGSESEELSDDGTYEDDEDGEDAREGSDADMD